MKFVLTLSIATCSVIGLAQSGITWSVPIKVNSSTYGNQHPRINTDASGNPLVLWGNGKNAYLARWTGSSFALPVQVNTPGEDIFSANWAGPDFAAKGDTVYAVYKETPEDSKFIYVKRSVDGGKSFGNPVKVDNIGMNLSRFPTVSVDAKGNPVVAFMKFAMGFSNAQWAVTKSNDAGATFVADVKASSYSGGVVCDCCPGAVVVSGNNVLMLYRDNLNNKRNMWMGVSSDGGQTFPSGTSIDNTNWMVNACPSSGPDGTIVGDTLISAFMSGASGAPKVYWSKTALTDKTESKAIPITSQFASAASQNFPRIAGDGNAVALVWEENGTDILLRFSDNIHNGFQGVDTLAKGSDMVPNADVTISKGAVHVVYQDDASGTVKYRKGVFSTAAVNTKKIEETEVFPLPANDHLNLFFREFSAGRIVLITDMLGRKMYSQRAAEANVILDTQAFPEGIYTLLILDGGKTIQKKIGISH